MSSVFIGRASVTFSTRWEIFLTTNRSSPSKLAVLPSLFCVQLKTCYQEADMSISPYFCCCTFVMPSFPNCQMLTFVSMLPRIHCILSPFWCSYFPTKVHVHQISTRPECLCSYLAKQTKLRVFSNSETWCMRVAVKLWSSPENRIQVLLKTVVMFRIQWAAVSLKGPHPGRWIKWRLKSS